MDKYLNETQAEMRELIFNIMEEISHIEQSIENLKTDLDYKINELQKISDSITEEQNKQNSLLSNINVNDFNLVKDEVLDSSKMDTLERKISNIEEIMKEGGVNIKQMSLIKEKNRWQIAIFLILAALLCESIYFFGKLFDGTVIGHFMYLSSTIPYLFIMYFMNNRMQKISTILQSDNFK